MKNQTRTLFVPVLMLLLSIPSVAIAATVSWNSNTTWSDGNAPTDDDNAHIGNATSSEVVVNMEDVDVSLRQLRIGVGAATANATLNVRGTSTLTLGAADTSIGRSAGTVGIMNIYTGGTVDTTGIAGSGGNQFGIGVQGTGYVYVEGGSLNTAAINLGNNSSGYGVLTINNGVVTTSSAVNISAHASGLGGTINLNGGTMNVGTGLYVGAVDDAKDATFNMTGGTLNGLSRTSMRLASGNGSSGNFNLTGGNVNYVAGMAIAFGSNSTAEATIDGGNWTSTSDIGITVGYGADSTGTLTVKSGNVSIASSGYHVGGASGAHGTFDVQAGKLDGTFLYVGSSAGSTGEMTVTGGNIQLSSDTRIGSSGNGTFRMTNGELTTQRFLMGVGSGAKGNATIEGGIVNVTEMVVGNKGNSNGTFTITGGTVNVRETNNGTRIASDANAQGTLSIQGGNYITTHMQLAVGSGANKVANLLISGGGNVHAMSDVVIGNSEAANNVATLNMTGGTFDVDGDFKMAPGAVAEVSSKSYAYVGGGSVLTIGGAIILSPESSGSVAEMVIRNQASISASSLSLGGESKLIFEIDADTFTGKLELTGSLGSSLWGNDASILIDLSGFSGDASNLEGTVLMSYLGSTETALESLVSIVSGSTGLDFAWTDNTGGSGRELILQSIPEPSTYAAIIGGLVLAAVMISRRRRNR